MQDKEIIENILTLTKSLAGIVNHGTIESSTKKVFDIFKITLNDTLDIQNKIYTQMTKQGWYKVKNVKQTKINETIKKINQN